MSVRKEEKKRRVRETIMGRGATQKGKSSGGKDGEAVPVCGRVFMDGGGTGRCEWRTIERR